MICSLKPIRSILVGIALLFLSSDAPALDPNRLPSQYVREEWTAGNRFTGGAVNAIVSVLMPERCHGGGLAASSPGCSIPFSANALPVCQP